jgi:16S rRNA processing protein RimM
VLGAHGIRGELRCRVITDFPRKRFRRGTPVLIQGREHLVESARVHGGVVLLKLQDVADRGTAEQLRGATVDVSAETAGAPPKGQYYWHQVIGLRVEDAHTHEPLGTVEDILETGANDVYIVHGDRGEILVPAIKNVVKRIDPDNGVMLVQLLPGMLPEPRARA